MYNLSGIQKGIQAGHAALEYANKFGHTEQYKDFIENHKTFILLDGGGSNDMIPLLAKLREFDVEFAKFYEPDLNGSLSAIAFLVPESIYGIDPTAIVYDTKDFVLSQFLKSFRLASN
jgi:hypothetical protein